MVRASKGSPNVPAQHRMGSAAIAFMLRPIWVVQAFAYQCQAQVGCLCLGGAGHAGPRAFSWLWAPGVPCPGPAIAVAVGRGPLAALPLVGGCSSPLVTDTFHPAPLAPCPYLGFPARFCFRPPLGVVRPWRLYPLHSQSHQHTAGIWPSP